MTNEEIRQFQERAEAEAQEMVKAVFGDDSRKLAEIREGLDQLEASNRELQRQIDLLNISAGLHKFMRVAARDGHRVDPVEQLRNGLMLGRIHDR